MNRSESSCVIWRLVSSTVTDRVLSRGKKSRDEVGVLEVGVLVEQSKQEALQSVLQQVHSQKREAVQAVQAVQAGELC